MKTSLKIAVVLLALNLWFLHGLDVQYYTIQNDWLFDANLYSVVVVNIFLIIMVLI